MPSKFRIGCEFPLKSQTMKHLILIIAVLITQTTFARGGKTQDFSRTKSLEDCREITGFKLAEFALCSMDLMNRGIARCNNQCCLPAEPFLVRFNNGFGLRSKPYRGNHKGIDLSYNWSVYNDRVEDTGTHPVAKVRAALEGEVVTKGSCGSGFGNCVEILHNVKGKKYKTRYAHLKSQCRVYQNLKVGDYVGSGDVIACMGNTGRSTGPHLHFEVLNPSGVQINPQDFCGFSDDFLNYDSLQ